MNTKTAKAKAQLDASRTPGKQATITPTPHSKPGGRQSAESATSQSSAPKRQKAQSTDKTTAVTAITDTKQSRLIALMRRPAGATLAELTEATGWQPHSVRGAISGVLRKKRGLTITLQQQAGGVAAYRIQA